MILTASSILYYADWNDFNSYIYFILLLWIQLTFTSSWLGINYCLNWILYILNHTIVLSSTTFMVSAYLYVFYTDFISLYHSQGE